MPEQKSTYLFGVNSVLEKLRASPTEVLEVLLAAGNRGGSLLALAEEARRHGIAVRLVGSKVLDRLAGGGKHQGVVARVVPYPYIDLATLLQELLTPAGHHWVLLLDGINDPRNFGALLRTAEAVGIRHVVIPKDRSVGVTPTVAKTSAGAVHHMRICRVANLRQVISALKERGYWAVGLEASAREEALGRFYPEKLVVVLGSEGVGIRPLIRQQCDFLVSLPMRGKVSSLNVSVAGGIFLYELLRQRERPPGRAGGGGSGGGSDEVW